VDGDICEERKERQWNQRYENTDDCKRVSGEAEPPASVVGWFHAPDRTMTLSWNSVSGLAVEVAAA